MASTTQALSKGGKTSRRGIDPLSILLAIAAIVILGLLILDLTLLPIGNKPAAQSAQPPTSGQQAAPTVIPTADTSSSYGDY